MEKDLSLVDEHNKWLYFEFRSGHKRLGIGNLFEISHGYYHTKGDFSISFATGGSDLIIRKSADFWVTSGELVKLRLARPSDFGEIEEGSRTRKLLNMHPKQILDFKF